MSKDYIKDYIKVYKSKALSQPTVCRWLERIQSLDSDDDDSDEENVPLPCMQSLSDKNHSGRPNSITTPDNKLKAEDIIQANRRITFDELSVDLDVRVLTPL